MNIVVLTGAGISAESGIQTFRAADGLWAGHRVEDVATPEGYDADPELVHDFYNKRRAQLPKVTPNAAHIALGKAEQACTGNFTLVTQNVDDLHERAGSQNLLHMHGELLRMRCACSGQSFEFDGVSSHASRCSCCSPAQPIRPDIVWFGEMPMYMERIAQALQECDLFVSIGTSGNVYPAAGFVEQAKWAGARCVELNLEPSVNAQVFDDGLYGQATQIVPEFFGSLD